MPFSSKGAGGLYTFRSERIRRRQKLRAGIRDLAKAQRKYGRVNLNEDEVFPFVHMEIGSILAVEILVFLKSHQNRCWTVEETSRLDCGAVQCPLHKQQTAFAGQALSTNSLRRICLCALFITAFGDRQRDCSIVRRRTIKAGESYS